MFNFLLIILPPNFRLRLSSILDVIFDNLTFLDDNIAETISNDEGFDWKRKERNE
jgi:hypothetical protein